MEARILAAFGEKAAAIARLREMLAQYVSPFELFSPVTFHLDRAFAGLRDDPEFQELAKPQG